MQVEGKLLIRSDGVRLLLSPYRQSLSDGKGARKRIQAQIQALSKETGLGFGTVRTLRDGSTEALLGAEHDCYPAGELVYEQLGGPERLFFAEEIAPGKFVVIAVDDRRVVLDEIVHSDTDLIGHFEVATNQFGEHPFTFAVNQAVLDALPSNANALTQLLDASVIETAVVLSALKFRAVSQIGSKSVSKSQTKLLAIAAGVLVAAAAGWMVYANIEEGRVAEEMALLAAMKNRAIDPLADYKRSMQGIPADAMVWEFDSLIQRSSLSRGWIPSRLEFEAGAPLKIAFSSFGGTRQQLVEGLKVPGGKFAQGPEGTLMLVDLSGMAGRTTVPHLEPLSKVLFETLDAIDASSMGVVKTQVGEIASFGQWSSQKIQINVEGAPLPLIKLISKALEGRPVNLTQAELSLENQSLSGVIHLDVFGS